MRPEQAEAAAAAMAWALGFVARRAWREHLLPVLQEQKTRMSQQKRKAPWENETQEEEGGMVAPWEIDRIAEKGVSSSDIKKLKDAGFTTCKSVLWTQRKKMVLHYLTLYLDISDCTSGRVCKFRWTLRGCLRQRSTTLWWHASSSRLCIRGYASSSRSARVLASSPDRYEYFNSSCFN